MRAALSLANLAEIAIQQGDVAAALAYNAQAAAAFRERGDPLGLAACVGNDIELSLRRGMPERAARMGGAAHAFYAERGYTLPAIVLEEESRLRAEIVAAIGRARAEQLEAEGAATPLADLVDELLRDEPPPTAANGHPGSNFGLTQRELEVLRLLTEGLTNQEIADRLFISARTAQTHVASILAKLDAGSRAAAAAIAVRDHLV
jgi:DNA-binding CsgD family transcriptional regulator